MKNIEIQQKGEEEDQNWNKTNDIITPKEQLSFLIEKITAMSMKKRFFLPYPASVFGCCKV